jgi:DNA polymerase-3 subunit epsilon
MKLHLKSPLVFFDLETTGINVVTDRIVEISMLKLMPTGERSVKTMKLHPGMPIPAEVSLIHGIYDEDVKDAPQFKEVAKEIAKFMEGADLAGYNMLKFDVPVLVEEFLRADMNFDVSKRKLIDAQRIFYLMEPRTLKAAYKFYCDKDLTNAHSAEADTIATFEVLMAQVARYEGVAIEGPDGQPYEPVKPSVEALHAITASKMVDLAGRMVYNQAGEIVFNFGKHKNRPVLDVLKKEPAYYDWIMNSEFPLNTKQKLTEIKLSQSGLKR